MDLKGLNEQQRKAVKQTEGPVLIIAGAGSGKTRVLTHRIAYLLDDVGVSPYNILAITFTNKAAAEMRERVNQTVKDVGSQIWVSTFHSTCVRILRRFADRIGYTSSFSIYDSDDQKSLMREVAKKMEINTKQLNEKTIMREISSAKDEMIGPAEYAKQVGSDYRMQQISKCYTEYEKSLRMNNAMDFDDLIYLTVRLFETDKEVLETYQERFKYIMVDEYQDTNTSQFRLVSLLAGKYRNLCVVGDDDQSIYKFRGANIYNILNFEKEFAGAVVIKLEQNYRSTQTILDAANAVIANNIGRKSKNLWTDNGGGEKIHFAVYDSGREEAEGVASAIAAKVRDGWNYNDIAILYRTNAQSRALEERLMMHNIPYRIYGGVNFYSRKEIKDILAYLKTISNGADGQSVKRIINTPKRGIGATTIERVQTYADETQQTFFDALCEADQIPGVSRGLAKIQEFVELINRFRELEKKEPIKDLIETIIGETGYIESLITSETREEVSARQENLDEFISKAADYEQSDDAPSLSGFLEEVSLVADIDNLDENIPQVMLMTLHAAKGLEFPIVFMTGMEDGIFPSYMTIVADDPTEVEEERRLCYVGITRAKKELFMTCAKQRMVRGEFQTNKMSRFMKEIPKNLLDVENNSTGREHVEEPFPNFTPGAMRQKGRAILAGYGTPTKKQYSNGRTRVQIGGSGLSGTSSSSSGFSGGRGTGSGNRHVDPVRRFATDYTRQALKPVVKPTPQTSEKNEAVGFGKKFPMDIFDLKKQKKTEEKPATVDSYKVSGAGLGYEVGDRVSHVKFGEGVVKDIKDATKDFMVTVEFDEFGTKKMLAGFAKLKKI